MIMAGSRSTVTAELPRPPYAVPLVLAMAVIFAFIAWLSVRHVNVLWYEQIGHELAMELVQNPLAGGHTDAPPARLPMYLTAALYSVVAPSIAAARLLGVAAGAATIILVYVAGSRWFEPFVGLLAAVLLAISPYILDLSRLAMAEGDAFWPVSVLGMVLTFDTWLRQRSPVSLVCFVGAMGLALAVQFLTVFFVPALIICDLLYHQNRPTQETADIPKVVAKRSSRVSSVVLVSAMMAAGFEILALVLTDRNDGKGAKSSWAAGLVILASGVVYGAAKGHRRQPVSGREYWHGPAGWMIIGPAAIAVCLAVCPAHVLQPGLPRSAFEALTTPDSADPITRFVDPARLYLGILLIKPGIPLGLIMLAGFGWAWRRSTFSAPLRLLVAMVGLHLLLLTTLPVRNPSWLMGVYPLLLLIAAAFMVHTVRVLRDKPRAQSAWIAYAATGCLYLAWGAIDSWPDFGLYGYRVIGNRWLGAESRGYHNLIHVTNDGTEDALRWCITHVPPGSQVASYLWDDHVIDAFVATHKLDFELLRRRSADSPERGPPIDGADYVVTSLNNDVTYRDLPPLSQQSERFGALPEHIVWRGRGGYRMPFVQIYKRQPEQSGSLATQETAP